MDIGNPDKSRIHETKGCAPKTGSKNLILLYFGHKKREFPKGNSPKKGSLIKYKQSVLVLACWFQAYNTAGSSLNNHWLSIRFIIVA
jgi:hypothetical protein